MSDRRLALAAALFAVAWPAPAAEAPEALSVRAAVERALARDPALQAAEQGAAEASAGLRMAQSPFRPQFLLTTTPGWTTGLPLQVAGEPPAAAGARLRMTFWDPALKVDEAGALGRSAGATATVEAARRETIRRAVTAYARLWAAERSVLAARRRAAAGEAIGARVAALGREGRVTDLDVRRAALEAARARHRLRTAESGRKVAAADLNAVVGLPGEEPPLLSDDPLEAVPDPSGLDALPAALASDPALRALTEETRSAARVAELEGRWFKPQVVAEARYLYVPPYYNYDQYFLKVDTNTASIGVSLVVPILSGGLETARAAQARAGEERLKDQRRAREEEIVRGVRAAAADVELAARELELARESLSVAEESLRVENALAREGRGQPDGVPRAEIEAADGEDAVARATEALVGARLALLGIRGGLSSLVSAPPVAR
jgi:outer membrane protein